MTGTIAVAIDGVRPILRAEQRRIDIEQRAADE